MLAGSDWWISIHFVDFSFFQKVVKKRSGKRIFAEEHKNSLSRKSFHYTLPPPFQENNGPPLMTEANQKKQ